MEDIREENGKISHVTEKTIEYGDCIYHITQVYPSVSKIHHDSSHETKKFDPENI